MKALVLERDRQRRDLGADHGRADADRPVEEADGPLTISPRHRWLGWAATGVMAAAVAFMFATSV